MGICGGILLWVSWSLFLVTLPFSLLVCFKVCKDFFDNDNTQKWAEIVETHYQFNWYF